MTSPCPRSMVLPATNSNDDPRFPNRQLVASIPQSDFRPSAFGETARRSAPDSQQNAKRSAPGSKQNAKRSAPGRIRTCNQGIRLPTGFPMDRTFPSPSAEPVGWRPSSLYTFPAIADQSFPNEKRPRRCARGLARDCPMRPWPHVGSSEFGRFSTGGYPPGVTNLMSPLLCH